MTPRKEILTISEVARQYMVSEETVRRWLKGGWLEYESVGPFKVRRKEITKTLVGMEGSNGNQPKS